MKRGPGPPSFVDSSKLSFASEREIVQTSFDNSKEQKMIFSVSVVNRARRSRVHLTSTAQHRLGSRVKTSWKLVRSLPGAC